MTLCRKGKAFARESNLPKGTDRAPRRQESGPESRRVAPLQQRARFLSGVDKLCMFDYLNMMGYKLFIKSVPIIKIPLIQIQQNTPCLRLNPSALPRGNFSYHLPYIIQRPVYLRSYKNVHIKHVVLFCSHNNTVYNYLQFTFLAHLKHLPIAVLPHSCSVRPAHGGPRRLCVPRRAGAREART